jgi:hypothetical protein
MMRRDRRDNLDQDRPIPLLEHVQNAAPDVGSRRIEDGGDLGDEHILGLGHGANIASTGARAVGLDVGVGRGHGSAHRRPDRASVAVTANVVCSFFALPGRSFRRCWRGYCSSTGPMETEPGTSAYSADRDAVLVCADEPLRSALAELVRTRGYGLVVSTTPLETVEVLLEAGARIGYALIASDLPNGWGAQLDAYLADEYPAIRRAILT